jgi:hypothetical protein
MATTRMPSGRNVNVLDLKDSEIDLHDIAHNLAMQCRWLGSCKYHYSVAQHCCYVAAQMYGKTRDFARTRKALMHDASEAYLGDVIRPIKEHEDFEIYRNAENQVQRLIEKHFHIQLGDDDLLKQIDNETLILEAIQLFNPQHFPPGLEEMSPTWIMNIDQWAPEMAESTFIRCFHDVELLVTIGARQFNVRGSSRV